MLIVVGYRTVAIEQVYNQKVDKVDGKKSADPFPAPVSLDSLKDRFKNKLSIFNRLTIEYTEAVIVHSMVSTVK